MSIEEIKETQKEIMNSIEELRKEFNCVLEVVKELKQNKRKKHNKVIKVSESKEDRIKSFVKEMKSLGECNDVLASEVYELFQEFDYDNGFGGKVDITKITTEEEEIKVLKKYRVNQREFGAVFSKYYDKVRTSKGIIYKGV